MSRGSFNFPGKGEEKEAQHIKSSRRSSNFWVTVINAVFALQTVVFFFLRAFLSLDRSKEKNKGSASRVVQYIHAYNYTQ